jgi:Ca-activated chloride channel homolog
MRTVWASLLAVSCIAGLASAQQWIGGAPYQARLLIDASGDTYVGVWVDAPAATVNARAPMAVSLVLDTSGSMAGAKIDNARMAASSLLETLHDGDIVSLYAFSDAITELTPPTVLSPASRALLMQRVGMIVPQGGTNMYDAMQVAVNRISQAPSTHPLRRIFLISDGRANVGPSDPESLGNLAARATEWGTQVTAIGVGVDYDQVTLSSMAVRSSGRVYHMSDSYQMATILEQELRLLGQSVALNAFIEVTPAPGVTILEGLTMGSEVRDGRLRLPLGALYAGQRRELLFRVHVDTSRVGSAPLATARLVYATPQGPGEEAQITELRYEITRNRNAVEPSMAPRVVAMVADREAVVAQQQASALLAQGNNVRAAVVLREAEHRIEVVAEAAPPAARVRLQARAQQLGTQSTSSGAAMSPPAQRQLQYDFNEDAMTVEGMGAPEL